jgi:peptidoglycan/xylan/chitin deacetylase (PgdA/CDA1 family)
LAAIPILAVFVLCLSGSTRPPSARAAAPVGADRLTLPARGDGNGSFLGISEYDLAKFYDRLARGPATISCALDAGALGSGCRDRLDPRHRQRIPILLYHVIADPPPGTPLSGLWVTPSEFSSEMRFLAEHRYHVVTLQEVFDYWHGASLPFRPVVISFDDGFRSDYTKARPILAAHGWAGTLNLSLSHLSKKTLTRRMVRELIAAGWEIDSHSLTHPFLPGLDPDRLEREIRGSRHALRALFDVDANFFAYPFGAYDRATVAAVRRAGYLGATTVGFGLAWVDDRYSLARIQIARGDGATGLARKLAALKSR